MKPAAAVAAFGPPPTLGPVVAEIQVATETAGNPIPPREAEAVQIALPARIAARFAAPAHTADDGTSDNGTDVLGGFDGASVGAAPGSGALPGAAIAPSCTGILSTMQAAPVRRQRPSTPPSRPTWCRSRRCRSRSSHARKRAKGRRDSPRPAGSGPHRGAAQRRQQRTRHLASRGRSRRYARSAAAGRARPRASATIRRTYDRQRFLAVLAAGSVFRRARSRNARAANSAHARNERRRETLPRSMPPCAATVWRPGSAAESTLGFS